MPNIKGIDLSDGVKILSGNMNWGNIGLTAMQITSYLAGHTVAQAETYIASFLKAGMIGQGEQIRVHIFTASPLKLTCIVANQDVVIPDNWWQ